MSDLIMVFDTETTGKADFQAAYDAPHQPDLVQLGYKVYHAATREVMFEIGHLVDTTQFSSFHMDPGAQAVHHIRTEDIMMYGLSPDNTMETFIAWLERCKMIVAHNKQFDTKIIQCFAKRAGYSPSLFDEKLQYCTMMSSTNICKIPSPSGRGGYKWPTLMEAYKHFTGNQFSGAHNALVDVNACGDIFWMHVEQGHLTLESTRG